jgi:glycosyltransferase involved in cell wall biosynthesis
MNVLILADTFGGERLDPAGFWLYQVARRWGERGHHTSVVCAGESAGELDPTPPGVNVWRPGAHEYEEALGEALAVEPNVVHIAGSRPFGPRVLEILRELPVLLDVHDFWPICPNDDLLRRPGLESCGEHFPYIGCGPCAGLPRLRAMEERAELVACARIVMAHSAFERTRLSAGLDRPVEQVEYGVDVLRFRPDEPAPPSDPAVAALFETRGRPRVLFLGPPTPARGAGRLTDLLVAMQTRVPDVQLVVAGRDGDNADWADVFKAEAAEMGLRDNAVLLPRVAFDDLHAVYAACQVAIAPGYAYEPGLFIVQAQAAGLPVVAHPSVGIEEWMGQGAEGLLVNARELGAFATSVAALLIDPIARNAFGESARLAALERHDFERSVVQLEELYRRAGARPTQSAAA